MPRRRKQTPSQIVKNKARRSLSKEIPDKTINYVIDTSAIINKFLPYLIRKGLKGKLIIPHAVMAELENLANKGQEIGFLGLEEISNLHNYKSNIKLQFEGIRPGEVHIKYAKSGEIDALIRDLAFKTKSTLITADLVQAKSAQAYGLSVIFLRPKIKVEKKKKFLFWKR